MNIYAQIAELELELNGIADLDELVQIRKELADLREQVKEEN